MPESIKRSALPIVLLLGAAAAVATWLLVQSAHAGPVPPAFVNGQLNYNPSVKQKLMELNGTLDKCLRDHGATKVPLDRRGWTYNDPSGSASAACAADQDAVNAYANSDEMHAAIDAMRPSVNAFWSCMQAHGIPAHWDYSYAPPSDLAVNASSACGGPGASGLAPAG